MYTCGKSDDEGAGFYAETKVTADSKNPSASRAVFSLPPEAALMCTDGKPAMP